MIKIIFRNEWLYSGMEYNVSAQLMYNAEEPGTLALNIRALHGGDESLSIEPGSISYFDYNSGMNRLLVLPVLEPGIVSISYSAIVKSQFDYINFSGLTPTPISQLDPATLMYLNPSRYCQSDKMARLALHLFGNIDNEYEQVLAINEWIHQHVEYLIGSTNGETSAYDTVIQRAGVCRDFAHLGIAFCRALDIPARYCSVYAFNLVPQDFHACFEAYLSGYWIMFDATKLAPLNGFIRIALGRDAADTAVCNLFGKLYGTSMIVNTHLIRGTMDPVVYSMNSPLAISYR
jgi:transglutaminase-like putative cysteine protease